MVVFFFFCFNGSYMQHVWICLVSAFSMVTYGFVASFCGVELYVALVLCRVLSGLIFCVCFLRFFPGFNVYVSPYGVFSVVVLLCFLHLATLL